MTILEALTATPQTKDHLAIELDYWTRKNEPNTRRVEEEIHDARLRGIPICSGEEGYWYARNSAEAFACYRWLRSKYLSQAKTAWAIKRAAARMQRQETEQAVLWDAA